MPNNDYILRSDALKAVCENCSMQGDEGQPCTSRCEDYALVLKIPAADVEPKRRWIPVTERLPKHLTSVIVHRKDGGIFIWEYFDTSPTDECWIDDSANVYLFYDVTHWMPLPEPPKEEKE